MWLSLCCKSSVDDLYTDRGVVSSRAALCCDLLRLCPLIGRFVLSARQVFKVSEGAVVMVLGSGFALGTCVFLIDFLDLGS